MNIERDDSGEAISTWALNQLKKGQVFRWANTAFDHALQHSLFWMVTSIPIKDDRLTIVNIENGETLVRDGSHRVITHEVTCSIKE